MEDKRKYLIKQQLKRSVKVVTSPRRQSHFHRLLLAGPLRSSEIARLPLSAWRVRARRIHIVGLKESFLGEYPFSRAEQGALFTRVRVVRTEPGPLLPSREFVALDRNRLSNVARCPSAKIVPDNRDYRPLWTSDGG